jgi:hypothetical protein
VISLSQDDERGSKTLSHTCTFKFFHPFLHSPDAASSEQRAATSKVVEDWVVAAVSGMSGKGRAASISADLCAALLMLLAGVFVCYDDDELLQNFKPDFRISPARASDRMHARGCWLLAPVAAARCSAAC